MKNKRIKNPQIIVIKTGLPGNSILYKNHEKYNYADSYLTTVNDPENVYKAVDIAIAFFSSAPNWVNNLMVVRNKIVSVFGLKTSMPPGNRSKQIEKMKFEAGEQVGLFKVFDNTDQEIILGEDDKHLNFRVSLFLENNSKDPSKKTITISTTITYNNWLGRFYFLPVKPMHQIIVPAMLSGIVKYLEKKRNKSEYQN
ncbi:MAG: DUF2867 domain-containing protein [Bacteroidia bacterium]|nr:DUF2867 domain-containing protein [Bacteroidia bacterium]